MTKYQQVPYHQTIDQVVDKIIWGVTHPRSLPRVKPPRPRPETIGELLEQAIYGRLDDYDDDDDYEDYNRGYSHPSNPRNNNQPVTDPPPQLSDILSREHYEKVYHFDVELYLTECTGKINIAVPIERIDDYQSLVEKITLFTNQDFGVVDATICSNSVGSCLKFSLNTETPQRDFFYVTLTEGVGLGLGMDTKKTLLSFTQQGKQIIFNKHI